MLIAQDFIDQNYPITKVLKILKIASSSYYYKASDDPKTRGIRKSTHTMNSKGEYTSNDIVAQEIESLLSQEFVDYGYRKTTHWLRQEKGYIINEKKVYRIMKEHNLLNKKVKQARTPKLWVSELVPQPQCAFEHLEFDIKYIYIAAKQRNALVLTIIDVSTRWVLGQYIDWKINKYNVRSLFDKVFSYYDLPSKMYVRNDNGSQFVAQLIRDYFASKNVIQEFTKPATPEQNAHIESYHSIMERVICQKYSFEDIEEAHETFNRWIRFYNFERIHSGIQYLSPVKYLKTKGVDILWDQELEVILDCKPNSVNLAEI